MKTNFIAVCLLLIIAPNAFAQTANRFEAGVGYAPFYLAVSEDYFNKKFDIAAYFEWRHVASNHFDYGAKLNYTIGPAQEGLKGTAHYLGALAVADFNAFPGKTVNPYIGIALGPAAGLSADVSRGRNTFSFLLSVSPRIGFELFNHLRVSASMDIVAYNPFRAGLVAAYMPMCFNVGWTF